MADAEQALKATLSDVERIAEYLKARPRTEEEVRSAADDLLSLCRYQRPVLGRRYD